MNTPALPSYLQNRRSPALYDRAAAGLGSTLPPHVSIQGNTFTLIDQGGNEQDAGNTLDACVVDISDVMCKQYYKNAWDPASSEPPTCWSANGVAPSREAAEPQSPLCGDCRWNIRGSAVSKISGAAIKACRDEKWLALAIPRFPGMLFRLTLTPGSFENWRNFLERFKGQPVDLSDVVTRITFQPKVNGVLMFAAASYIDEATAQLRETATAQTDKGRATDILVGRNDQPRALPAPTGGTTTPLPVQAVASPLPGASFLPGSLPSTSPSGIQPQPGTSTLLPAGTAVTASPTEAAPRKRRGRPAAQTENPDPNAQAPFAQPAANVGASAAGPATGAAFGIGTGAAPNAEMTQQINDLFGRP